MRIPLLDLEVQRPTRSSVAYYTGIGAMAAVGAIEWPLAAVVAAGHLISENTQSPQVSAAADGVQSGS